MFKKTRSRRYLMKYVRPRTAQAQLSICIALAERGKNHYVLASDEAYMDTMIEV